MKTEQINAVKLNYKKMQRAKEDKYEVTDLTTLTEISTLRDQHLDVASSRKNFRFCFDNISQENKQTDLNITLDYLVPKCIAVKN